jgi:hypothetical protein
MKSLLGKSGFILIIGLVIFGYAEVCNAECAWVLWIQVGNRVEGRWYPPQWKILSAFPTYDLCVQSRIKDFNYYKDIYSYNKFTISIYGDGSGFAVSDPTDTSKIVFSYESKCLPDTLDLRK